MKKLIIQLAIAILAGVFIVPVTFAGNKQRAGQAGAPELLINPWARSSGLGGANSASVKGLEAIYSNVAGTSFTKKTELIFANSQWMTGADISINAFGFAQKLGESGVLCLSVMSIDFGLIDITTTELPEGGLGTFHPQYTNITASFAKEFSNSIHGGLAFKVINQGISDVKATGVALDAGIQYVTGFGLDKAGNRNRDNFAFGISMKNVGPEMRYGGDGMSFRSESPYDIIMTSEYRTGKFELPSCVKIGMSYEIKLAQQVDSTNNEVKSDHRISLAANFTSNSFTKDQIHGGLEYSFREMVMIRGGYIYESGIFGTEKATMYNGPTAGISVEIPLSKETGTTLAIDYSYRSTENFNGIHSIGARVNL